MSDKTGQDNFEQELVSALDSLEPPAGLQESLVDQVRLQAEAPNNANNIDSTSRASDSQSTVELAQQSANGILGIFSSKAFLIGASSIACAVLLGIGLAWMNRPRSPQELLAFCKNAAETQTGWSEQELSEETYYFLRSNFKGISPAPGTSAECLIGDAGEFGSTQRTWKIDSYAGVLYVTEIEDAYPVENLSSAMRILRGASPWSYGALHDGNRVFVVTTKVRLRAFLLQSA
ncbi:MAG: hypothetical protein AAF483_05555 [Planctomycetota bacterium]